MPQRSAPPAWIKKTLKYKSTWSALGKQPSPPAPVDIPADRFNQMVRLPVPAYVIGVDLVTEESFLVVATKTRRARVSGLSRAYPLADDRVKIGLYREVSAYWAAHKSLRTRTGFRDV